MQDELYVSQYSSPVFGVTTRSAGEPATADAGVTATFAPRDDPGSPVFEDRVCIEDLTGQYEVAMTSADTQATGFYTLTFNWEMDGSPELLVVPVEIGASNPHYDDLTDGMKGVVNSVWARFADLYDSPIGGPHLQVYVAQGNFGRGRVAQLMGTAMNRLNTLAQPVTSYSVNTTDGGKEFPLARWGGLLEQLTYIEVIKHLIRSYVEQPDPRQITVAHLDRRDYLQRWQSVLQMELEDSKDMLENFKIEHMGLGNPGIIVSGGAYGRFGPWPSGSYAAARPRYYYRV